MIVSWSALKTVYVAKGICAHGTEDADNYYLHDGSFGFRCILPKANVNSDLEDFATNWLSGWNKPTLQVPSAFSAKTLPNGKKLYVRNHGVRTAVTIPTGDPLEPTSIAFEIPYPWVKIVGAEVIGGEALDYLNFKVFDDGDGTYSQVPYQQLNQFGFETNVAPGFYSRLAPYDADLYLGMVVTAEYYSVSAKTIGINLIMNEVKP